MKQNLKVLVPLYFFIMLFLPLAHGAGDHPQPPPDTSSAELNRIKALAGRWETTTSMFGKPNEKAYTEYEITAGGSAVLERIFPGTPHEMISVYYDDDKGRLAMTHYCIMRNRPQLTLVKVDGDTLTLDIKKVDGVKSKDDPSMGAVTITFKDKDHYQSTCRGRGKGAENEAPMTMDFTRVK